MRPRLLRKGTAALEFAIGSGVFVALFTGTFGFGYTFYTYNKLETATRNGSRYGGLLVYDQNVQTVNSVPSSSFVTAVKNVTVYGTDNPGEGAVPVVGGLTTANVAVDVLFANGEPDTVTVSIRDYQVRALFQTWTANQKPRSTFRFMGRFAPL
jgi:Flp pilus assembly protein TadG